MVDPGLLGELPLGHLLRLELSSEPFIEGSTGLVDHRVVPGAPFGFPAPLRDTTTIGSPPRAAPSSPPPRAPPAAAPRARTATSNGPSAGSRGTRRGAPVPPGSQVGITGRGSARKPTDAKTPS